jgi:hypothetical protein
MSSVINAKIATCEATLVEKKEYLAQVQNAERVTTQEIIGLQGAIQVLKDTQAEMLSSAGQASEAVECEMPQPGTVELG